MRFRPAPLHLALTLAAMTHASSLAAAPTLERAQGRVETQRAGATWTPQATGEITQGLRTGAGRSAPGRVSSACVGHSRSRALAR